MQNIVKLLQIKEGVVHINVVGTCASIVSFEDEGNLAFDVVKLLENIVPINKIYQHDVSWHEGNAHAHLKSVLMGNGLTFSCLDGKLLINEFQKIALLDFDNKLGMRQVTVSVIYW